MVRSPDSRLVAAIGVAIVVTGVVILTVPKFRARIVPAVRNALSGIWEVARIRHKRLELLGGRLAAELLYALSLGATCLAYDIDLNLAQLVFVNMAAGRVSGLIPTPGGIGAAEVSISAGLIAVGVEIPRPSRSRSPSACGPSTCPRSGATRRSGGSHGRASSSRWCRRPHG